jgi:CubicO group peptidase (beta-lactamase class C family)
MGARRHRAIATACLVLLLVGLKGCAITYAPGPSLPTLPKVAVQVPAAIDEAHRFLAEKTQFDAFAAMRGEAWVTQWGKADVPINTHSVRKSVLSALFGIAQSKGLLRLDRTLAALGIQEPSQPLTDLELTATIEDLLKSRSGIYLQASGETAAMREARPRRGQHRPGEAFYYNNWDFNVLGAIFEQETKLTLGEALYAWIARPTGMTTFRPEHVIYVNESGSRYRQFVVYMSASDLARLGMVFAQKGVWAGQQVVPAAWVAQSLAPYSPVKSPRPFDGYGYMWWLDSTSKTAWADGWRGQYMIVDPARQLVVVSRNDTGRDLMSATWARLFGKDAFRDHHQFLHRKVAEAVGAELP